MQRTSKYKLKPKLVSRINAYRLNNQIKQNQKEIYDVVKQIVFVYDVMKKMQSMDSMQLAQLLVGVKRFASSRIATNFNRARIRKLDEGRLNCNRNLPEKCTLRWTQLHDKLGQV